MDKQKYPTKSVSFLWVPSNYPVEWAQSPKDVPPWDTSRGYPSWEQTPENTVDFIAKEETKLPPAEGYPRLVRLPGLGKGRGKGKTREKDDVVDKLLVCYPYISEWRAKKNAKKLKDNVLELAETYGPPYRNQDNTLEVWLELISRVQVAINTLRVLDDVGYVAMKAYLEGRRSEIFESGTKLADGRVRADAPAEAEFYEIQSYLFDARLLENKFWNQGNIEGAEEAAGKEYRVYMADLFYGQFTAPFCYPDDAGRAPLHFTTQGIFAFSSIGDWVLFKVSEEWRKGEGVKVCPICGALFTANHGNRKYCRRSACRNKAFRLKQ